jgi:Kef-type K+ transport system membrane component KefB
MASAVSFDHDAQIAMFVALTTLLGLSRLLGELARFVHQPAVLGEIIAGIVLGQTVLGRMWKSGYGFLFRTGSASSVAFQAVAGLAVTLFTLVAGIEMSLGNVPIRRNRALAVAVAGIITPFGGGIILTYFAFDNFDPPPGANRIHFALVIGVDMSITALPVVAKTLRDIHLYHTDIGITVMSAATVNDLIGWSLFAVTLSFSGSDEGRPSLAISLSCPLVFVVALLTIGRWLFDLLLPHCKRF